MRISYEDRLPGTDIENLSFHVYEVATDRDVMRRQIIICMKVHAFIGGCNVPTARGRIEFGVDYEIGEQNGEFMLKVLSMVSHRLRFDRPLFIVPPLIRLLEADTGAWIGSIRDFTLYMGGGALTADRLELREDWLRGDPYLVTQEIAEPEIKELGKRRIFLDD